MIDLSKTRIVAFSAKTGGYNFDGVMFDLVATQKVSIYSMDIISSYVGQSSIEIYIREQTWAGADADPTSWIKITAFDLVMNGFSEPTRIPDNAFDQIEMSVGDIVSFYITSTGNLLQMTRYSDSMTGSVHESTNELTMLVGVGKIYPFKGHEKGIVWNGRIFYDIIPTSAPTPLPSTEGPTSIPIASSQIAPVSIQTNQPSQIPVTSPTHSNNFCGETRADAIKLCDKPCSNGLDSECASNEECFINVLANECEGM